MFFLKSNFWGLFILWQSRIFPSAILVRKVIYFKILRCIFFRGLILYVCKYTLSNLSWYSSIVTHSHLNPTTGYRSLSLAASVPCHLPRSYANRILIRAAILKNRRLISGLLRNDLGSVYIVLSLTLPCATCHQLSYPQVFAWLHYKLVTAVPTDRWF